MKKYEKINRWLNTMTRLGVSTEDAWALRRIEMTLHRWYEAECGDGNDHASWAIERDETTDKPFRCVYPHNGRATRTPIADRERGALKRLAIIMKRYPALRADTQSDPRGCALSVTDGTTTVYCSY